MPRAKGREALRERLFDQGVAAVARTVGISDGDPRSDSYLCPLCLRYWPRAALTSRDLTLEHVPPESLGGRELILTCKKCNGEAGTRLDAEASKLRDLDRFGEPGTSADVRIKGVAAQVNFGEDHMLISLSASRSHPAHHQELTSVLDFAAQSGAGLPDLPFVSEKAARRDLAAASHLRSGYLAAFALLGYRYVLQPCMARIREAVVDPDSCDRPVGVVHAQGELTDRFRAELGNYGFGMVREPLELASIVVHMPAARVYLPAPGQTDAWYDEIRDQMDLPPAERSQLRFALHPWIPRPQFQLDK